MAAIKGERGVGFSLLLVTKMALLPKSFLLAPASWAYAQSVHMPNAKLMRIKT